MPRKDRGRRKPFRAPKLPGKQRRLFEDAEYKAYLEERRKLEALGRVSRPPSRDDELLERIRALDDEKYHQLNALAARKLRRARQSGEDVVHTGPILESALDELEELDWEWEDREWE